MMVALNSPSAVFLKSVLLRSLAVDLLFSFIWDEFLHLGVLSESLTSSLVGKARSVSCSRE